MGYLLRSSALQHRVPPTPSQAVIMVVTSKLLAAHTSGYPLDVSSRFWTNYYRSLKDVHTDGSNPRRAATEVLLSRGGTTFPPYAPHPSPTTSSLHTRSSTTRVVHHTYRL